MTKILRYGSEEERSVIYTPLDPIEDLSNQLAGLRSEEYVSSVLMKKHNLPRSEASGIAPLVGHLALNAVGFLRQAYAGPTELCFLPVYYAILSLSKVYILCRRGAEDLQENSHHGARCPPRQSGPPLDHRVEIRSERGVFPLFYQVLTGRKPEWHDIDISTLLNLVPCVESELAMALSRSPALCYLDVHVEELSPTSFRLRVEILQKLGHPAEPSNLVLLRNCELTRESTTGSRDTFVGEASEWPDSQYAMSHLLSDIPRDLLYYRPVPFWANMVTSTPSDPGFTVPEEIPLWLLFFWLSNLVRYSPERVSALQGTSLWPILLALRKHAMLRFLILFWSFFHQTSFGIKAGTM